MSLTVTQSKTALTPLKTAFFRGTGGTAPYTYAVLAGGSGGTIDSTGLYTAPATMATEIRKRIDTIEVTDFLGAKAQTKIEVGTVLHMVAEILRKELELSLDHCYLYDQKVFKPEDEKMYLSVGVENVKVYGNNQRPDGDGNIEVGVNCIADLHVEIMSRSDEALHRKEEVAIALGSVYAEAQQNANSFSMGRNVALVDVSEIDGAAIPYRFVLTTRIQYAVSKMKSEQYYETVQETVLVQP